MSAGDFPPGGRGGSPRGGGGFVAEAVSPAAAGAYSLETTFGPFVDTRLSGVPAHAFPAPPSSIPLDPTRLQCPGSAWRRDRSGGPFASRRRRCGQGIDRPWGEVPRRQGAGCRRQLLAGSRARGDGAGDRGARQERNISRCPGGPQGARLFARLPSRHRRNPYERLGDRELRDGDRAVGACRLQ